MAFNSGEYTESGDWLGAKGTEAFRVATAHCLLVNPTPSNSALATHSAIPVPAPQSPLRIRRDLNKLLLGSVASIPLLCSLATDALAACVETSPGVYDCSGSNPGWHSKGSFTVNLLTGGSFYSDSEFQGPGTSVFNNDGTVSNNVHAMHNDRFTLNNRSSISGTIFLQGSGFNFINNTATGSVQNGVNSVNDSIDYVVNRGYFAGLISLGDGNDRLDLISGTLASGVDMGDDDDFFDWSGGFIPPSVQMGQGNDAALFRNLTEDNLSAGKIIDGGQGADRLTWSNSSNSHGNEAGNAPSDLINWEDIRLTNGSEMTFIYSTTVLTLGDSATGTGTLSIDGTSAVRAGNSFGYGVKAFDSSQLVTVYNAGLIDMTNDMVSAGGSLHDTFTVYGNYVGQQGGLQLHTVLESDDAPSDKLVISGTGASASGETFILITNVGGEGALTLADGIRVVDATAGATTEGTAFTLGAPVAAGIFEYQLYRGGVTEDPENDDDWFLRLSLIHI